MKRTTYILSLAALLVACDYNDDNFDGLDEMVAERRTDVKILDYTLTDDDYAAISKYKSDEPAIANELAALANAHAFALNTTAEQFIPSLLASLYPTADDKSTIQVTYDIITDSTATLLAVSHASTYTLTDDDYNAIDAETPYITDKTEQKIANVLKDNISNADKGAIVVASYKTQNSSRLALYSFNGSAWSQPTDAYILNLDDYNSMGIRYANFNSTLIAQNNLPIFLSIKFPYAQPGDIKVAAFHIYDSATKTTSLSAIEYTYDGTAWTPTTNTASVTDQFVKVGSAWAYIPNVTIDLAYDGKPQSTVDFLQAICDWTWENIDEAQLGIDTKGQGYVSSYGNSEFYTGASAYYCEMDWRPAKFREQYPAGYDDCADDAAVLLRAQEHLIEALPHVLASLYPDANVIEASDVIYTINFYAYNNDGQLIPWTIDFKVVGRAAFEYVEGSLLEVK